MKRGFAMDFWLIVLLWLVLVSILCFFFLLLLRRSALDTFRWRAKAQEFNEKASQWRFILMLADIREFHELPDGDYQREKFIGRFGNLTLWIINQMEPLGSRHEIKVIIPANLVWDKCFTIEKGQIFRRGKNIGAKEVIAEDGNKVITNVPLTLEPLEKDKPLTDEKA